MMNSLKLATATTPSKIRANLTHFLKEVTTQNTEIHIVLSSGKNAVLVSEESLNDLKRSISELERAQAASELSELISLNNPNPKKYTLDTEEERTKFNQKLVIEDKLDR